MATEIHLDDSPLATGTHKGSAWTYIVSDPGADFKSCGVTVGVYCENETDGSAGLILTVAETYFACSLTGGSDNEWQVGDTYNIYKTATKGSEICRINTDRRFGQKVFRQSELNQYGHTREDEDIDIDGRKVFGPWQPERAKTR